MTRTLLITAVLALVGPVRAEICLFWSTTGLNPPMTYSTALTDFRPWLVPSTEVTQLPPGTYDLFLWGRFCERDNPNDPLYTPLHTQIWGLDLQFQGTASYAQNVAYRHKWGGGSTQKRWDTTAGLALDDVMAAVLGSGILFLDASDPPSVDLYYQGPHEFLIGAARVTASAGQSLVMSLDTLGIACRDGNGNSILPPPFVAPAVLDFVASPIVTGCFSGCKFNDLNCNGVWDPNEPGLPGWTIVATNNATGQVFTATTGTDGCYSFSGLPLGTYSVTEIPQPGWQRSYPPCQQYTVTLDAQHHACCDLDPVIFGNCHCPPYGDDIRLSTGVDDATGGLLPVGSPDDTWHLICRPDWDFPPLPQTTSWVVPPGMWGAPQSYTEWISADPNGYLPILPAGDYCYEACFELCSRISQGVLSVLVDDTATVYVNGIEVQPVGSPCNSSTTQCDFGNLQRLFRPGRNCIDIVVHNDSGAPSASGLDVWGIVKIDTPCCVPACPCTPPPSAMVAWWPLDETTGTTAADIAGNPDNGTYVNGPTVAVGAVGLCRQFVGNQFVNVPPTTRLAFGQADFSVDAWIKADPNASTARNIFSKFDSVTGAGFRMFLDPTGNLYVTVTNPPTSFSYFYTGPTLADHGWHHVAMTVMPNSFTGFNLYVDGVGQNQGGWAGSDWNAVDPIHIGGAPASETHTLWIDEVEVFRRALTAVEVDRIYQASSEGKCRTDCYVPSATGFCLAATSVTVPVTVCNYSPTTQTYSISGTMLNSGTNCSVPGTGAVITPASATITVPPGGCGVRYFNITRPTGLNVLGATACFSFMISQWLTGEIAECNGTLIDRRDVCTILPCPWCWPNLALAPNAALATTFDLSDTSTGTPIGDLNYRLEAREHNSGLPAEVISLNGLPPGEPVIGTLTLPPPGGGAATLDVELAALDLSPFTFYELVLSSDANGDGTYEPLYVMGIEPEFGPTLSAAWCENFDAYATDAQVAGQPLWQGWDNNPAAGALTSSAEAHSPPNSVAVVGATDLVHEFAGVTSGRWILKAWQYVPSEFVSHCDGSGNCGSYFMLLNTYQDGGPYSWTVQLRADSITNAVIRDDALGASLPLVHDSWAEIKTVFDLDQDWFRVFYNGTELGTQGSWTNAFPGQTSPGVLNLGALDLYANQSTVVYYDDICLRAVVPMTGDLNCDGVVNFDDINPFVLALSDPAGYANAYPECYLLNGDCNGDGTVNFDDINPFVAILSGG